MLVSMMVWTKKKSIFSPELVESCESIYKVDLPEKGEKFAEVKNRLLDKGWELAKIEKLPDGSRVYVFWKDKKDIG